MGEKININLADIENAMSQILRLMDANRWDIARECYTKLVELHTNDVRAKILGTILQLFDSKMVDNKTLVSQQQALQKMYHGRVELSILHNLFLKILKSDEVLHDNYSVEVKDKIVKHMCLLWSLMAASLRDQQRYAEAINKYKKILSYLPNHLPAKINSAITKFQMGNLAEAKQDFLQINSIKQDDEIVHAYLGCTHHQLKEYVKAKHHFTRAVELNPQKELYLRNLATINFDTHNVVEAIKYYKKILQLEPNNYDDRKFLGMLQLMQGNYLDGFGNYEARMMAQDGKSGYNLIEKYPQAHWTSKNIRGKKILLISEQGLGDTIFALRYIPLLLEQNVIITLLAKQCLHELISCSYPEVSLITELTNEQCNGYIHLMSLPHLFGTTLATVPNNVPYLQVAKEKESKWDKIITSKRLKVGIVWFGGTGFKYDADRSMSLKQFAHILPVDNVIWYSLQIGGSKEIQQLDLHDKITDLEEHLSSFAETAGAISQLDLVIAVDTSVVHLAGALGKPVWMLNRYLPDWRWMLEDSESVWYPSMRIFRQDNNRSWDNVLQNVKKELISISSKYS